MVFILRVFAAGTGIAAWRSDDTFTRVFLVCACLGNLVTFASVLSQRNPTMFQTAPVVTDTLRAMTERRGTLGPGRGRPEPAAVTDQRPISPPRWC